MAIEELTGAGRRDDADAPLPAGSWLLLRRLAREFLRPHLGHAAIAVVCMLLMATATTGKAWLLKEALDRLVGAHGARWSLPVIAAGFLAVTIVRAGAGYFQTVLMTDLGQAIVGDIQKRVFARLVTADLGYLHASSSGRLTGRFSADANALRSTLTQLLTGLGRDTFSLIGLLAYLVSQDWLLALVAIGFFAGGVWPVRQMGRRMRRVSRELQRENGRLFALMSQIMLGIRHVKAYGMEPHERARAFASIDRISALNRRIVRVRGAMSPLIEIAGGIAAAGVIVYADHAIADGTHTPGVFLAFVGALLLAFEPARNLANLHMVLQQGLAAAERVFAVIDVEPLVRDRPGVPDIAVRGGAIRFDGVGFSYDRLTPVLEDLTIEVPAGQTVALVGPSGGGKSTIVNLILRFYDADSGTVAIDGQDIRDVGLASLRAATALVSQEVSLFDDTIRSNIAYGKPAASDAEIVAAAKSAGAHDFILALPGGYDTMVGEQGVRLSGGQRQRIAIARAMLKNAPILLLDEATSSLDTDAERHVQEALQRLAIGRTTIVVAHRLSTIVEADLIYVIDRGRVAESGSHKTLIARDGIYARLWARQQVEALP